MYHAVMFVNSECQLHLRGTKYKTYYIHADGFTL